MYVYLRCKSFDFMNHIFETTLKQSSSYDTPAIKVIEIDLSQLLCHSNPSTDFEPEIDELP